MKKTLCWVLFFSVSANVSAGTIPPKEDIHFLAEHLAEAAQDARYFAMPWPVGDYHDKAWKPLVSIAGAHTSLDFATAQGGLLTLGLSKALSDRWALEILVYYDRFDVSGSQTENTLSPFSLNGVPLDLPATAVFSNPRGKFEHRGIGTIISHELDYGNIWHWDVFGGLLLEELVLTNYQFDYQLTGGNDVGEAGVLDHSGSNSLVYAIVGGQIRKRLANGYEIIPRLVLGMPIKNGDFTARLSGRNFDLSTDSTGAEPHRIGDGFIYMGMTMRDISTHLEMDLGAVLGYEVFEVVAHEGVSSALMVSATWRM